VKKHQISGEEADNIVSAAVQFAERRYGKRFPQSVIDAAVLAVQGVDVDEAVEIIEEAIDGHARPPETEGRFV
jgi:hypothetical protein